MKILVERKRRGIRNTLKRKYRKNSQKKKEKYGKRERRSFSVSVLQNNNYELDRRS